MTKIWANSGDSHFPRTRRPGHTQRTLNDLFVDLSPEVRHRITIVAFEELVPGTPAVPAQGELADSTN